MAVNPVVGGFGATPEDEGLCGSPSFETSGTHSQDSYSVAPSLFDLPVCETQPEQSVALLFAKSAADAAKQSQGGGQDPVARAQEAVRRMQEAQREAALARAQEAIRRMQEAQAEAAIARAQEAIRRMQDAQTPAAPPAPAVEISARQLRRWTEKYDELMGRNTEERVAAMDRQTATRRLRDVNSFLRDVPEAAETHEMRIAVEAMKSRLETRLVSLFQGEIEAVPYHQEYCEVARAAGTIRAIDRHLRTLVELNTAIDGSELSDTQKQALRVILSQRQTQLEVARIALEEGMSTCETTPPTPPVTPPVNPPPVPFIEQPIRVPPGFETAPPPVEASATVSPPEPSRAQVRAFTRIEGQNSSEDIEGMNLNRAISNLERVTQFIEENGADAAAGGLVAQATSIQDLLCNRIFNLVMEKVVAMQQEAETISDEGDIRDRLRDIASLRDKVNESKLDESRRGSLIYVLGEIERILNTRSAELQAAAELRRVQGAAQEAVNEAQSAVEQFLAKALKAREAAQEVAAAASGQCIGRRAFRDLRENAVEAIEQATAARQNAEAKIAAAAAAMAALNVQQRSGLTLPTIPTGEEARIPDVQQLSTSQATHIGQPVVHGRRMTVSCDCNGEISQQIDATRDAFTEKITSVLNQWSFPPTMVLIAQVTVELDDEGYVSEVTISATDRVRDGVRTSGEDLMEDPGMRNWYYKIASAFCRYIRAENGRDGRTIREIPIVIRAGGGGMSFQTVSE